MKGVLEQILRTLRSIARYIRLAAIARMMLVGFLPFICGIVVSKLYDRYTDSPPSVGSRPLILIALTATLCLILSGFAIAALFIETLRGVDDLRFELRVVFVSDGPGAAERGLTYARTRSLVEMARESLVFLDYWVEPRRSADGPVNALGDKRRRAYYEAIISKIAARKEDGTSTGVFHRRIVQLPGWETGNVWLDAIRNDGVYVGHLKSCRDLQEQHRSTQIKGAAPYIHTHFAIIDGRHVVLPILRADPEKGGLTRHGAIFIEDRNQKFVRKLMELFDKIDGEATPIHLKDIP
jgi:hypothetical protein